MARPLDSLELAIKAIIADGCSCDRDCKNTGYCGCLNDAREIIQLIKDAGYG